MQPWLKKKKKKKYLKWQKYHGHSLRAFETSQSAPFRLTPAHWRSHNSKQNSKVGASQQRSVEIRHKLAVKIVPLSYDFWQGRKKELQDRLAAALEEGDGDPMVCIQVTLFISSPVTCTSTMKWMATKSSSEVLTCVVMLDLFLVFSQVEAEDEEEEEEEEVKPATKKRKGKLTTSENAVTQVFHLLCFCSPCIGTLSLPTKLFWLSTHPLAHFPW